MVKVKETRLYESALYGVTESEMEVEVEYDSWDDARKNAYSSNEDIDFDGIYTVTRLENLDTGGVIDDYGY